MIKKLVTYWFKWRFMQLWGYPEYTYAWYRGAYRVKVYELCKTGN